MWASQHQTITIATAAASAAIQTNAFTASRPLMAVGLSEAGQEGNTWGEEACLCFDRILSELKCLTR